MYEDEQYPPLPQQNPFVRVDSKDPNFNQWFLDNKEDINNLKMHWQGWVRDNNGNWRKPTDFIQRRLMNDEGIHWAMQMMESYLSHAYLYTNWDREEMNFEMRELARVIWRGLTFQYEKFGLNKINTYVIGKQMFSQIHAIMLSARGEGIRKYLGTVQQTSEIKNTSPNQNPGFFSNVLGMFRGRGGQ